MKKRGLSPIIATVLIILITVVAASIILAFVVPFVQNSLAGTKECYDVLGDVSFAQTGYSCYNATGELTGFSVKIEGEGVGGFNVVLGRDGNSDSFRIENGTQNPGIKMLGGSLGLALTVPENGGVRTYVINSSYRNAEVYPILKSGRVCDMADSIQLNPCVDRTL